MLDRICLTLINLFFPPLTVLIICGPSSDCLINSFLFLCGVIPAHIHGFYISCTYYHRRRKVRKGRYPGGAVGGISSRKVWNGGASDEEVARLKFVDEEKRAEKEGRKKSGADWRGVREGDEFGKEGMGRSRSRRGDDQAEMVGRTRSRRDDNQPAMLGRTRSRRNI